MTFILPHNMAPSRITTWRSCTSFLPFLAIGIVHIATGLSLLRNDPNYPILFDDCENYKRKPLVKEPFPIFGPATCVFVSEWLEMLAVPRSRAITASIFSMLAALISIYYLESGRPYNRQGMKVVYNVMKYPTPLLLLFHLIVGGLVWELVIIPAFAFQTRAFIRSQTAPSSQPEPPGNFKENSGGIVKQEAAPGYSEPASRDMVNNTEVMAVTFGVAIGFILPTILLLIYNTDPFVILFWSGFPIWIGSIRRLIRTKVQHSCFSYETTICAGPVGFSAVLHAWWLYDLFKGTDGQSPMTQSTLAAHMIDAYYMYAAALYWLFVDAGFKAVGVAALVSVIFGPGAGICLGWLYRGRIIERLAAFERVSHRYTKRMN